MTSSLPELQVHNVVATIQINCEPIDINYLRDILPYTSYDKSKFAAITIRLSDPVCTCLLFTSGKLVVTGASSWEEALLTGYCIRDILRESFHGKRFEISSYTVQNMVAHIKVGRKISLERMAEENNREITYQKNMFPGLIFRSLDCSVVLLCFSSGKIVITGGKSISHLSQSWKFLWKTVSRYLE